MKLDFEQTKRHADLIAKEDHYRLSPVQYFFFAKLFWLGWWMWAGPVLGGVVGTVVGAALADVFRNGVCR